MRKEKETKGHYLEDTNWNILPWMHIQGWRFNCSKVHGWWCDVNWNHTC